jgi:predicted nucleotidyltransferase
MIHEPADIISDAEREAIIARLKAAQVNRPQRIARMKQRQVHAVRVARQAAEVLKTQFGVTRVVLFGSILNPEMMHERSDIDLAVWGLSIHLLLKAGCAVDRITIAEGFGESDLVAFETAYPHIQASILKTGLELMTNTELFQQMHSELQKMQETLDTNRRFIQLCESSLPHSDSYDAAIGSLALNAQGFYTGAERILIMIAKAIDGLLPQGQDWHRDLLAQMATPFLELRPAIIGDETLLQLQEFRRFRHVVRKAYSGNLIPEKVLELAEFLEACFNNFYQDCCSFQQSLS